MTTDFELWKNGGLLLLALFMVIMMYLLGSFIYQSHKFFRQSRTKWRKEKLAMLCVGTLVLSTVYMGLAFYNTLHTDAKKYSDYGTNSVSFFQKTSSFGVYDGVYTLFYLSLVLRICQICGEIRIKEINSDLNDNDNGNGNGLKDSLIDKNKYHSLSIPKRQVLILLILIALLAALLCLTWLVSDHQIYSENDIVLYGTIVIAAVAVVDIIFNIFLLVLFVKRFFLVMQNMDELLMHELSNIKEESSKIDENDLESIEKLGNMNQMFLQRSKTEQNEVIDIMVKILCLTITSEIFQHVFYFVLIFTNIFVDNDDYDFRQWIFLRTVRSVAIVTNSFALYFTFIYTQEQYNWCCMLCHRGIKKFFIKRIKKKNIKHRDKQSQRDCEAGVELTPLTTSWDAKETVHAPPSKLSGHHADNGGLIPQI